MDEHDDPDDFYGFACRRCGQCVQDEEEMESECPFRPLEDDEPIPCNWDETLIHEDENGEWYAADEQ
jgi:hypothetical protein